MNGGFVLALPDWIPACAGIRRSEVVSQSVSGKPYLDEVLGCFHSMADFDAGCFALHCVDKELCDGVSILGQADNVLL